jgi:manganese/iron transport system ATP-binding protein
MAWFREIQRTEQAIRRQHAQHHAGEPIVRVDGLTVGYENGYALENVRFEIPRAMRLAVLGPNGAGKSTLLKVLAGVLTPTRGAVQIFGEEPGGHICIAYVPQRSQVDWNFPVRIKDVVMMGRIGQQGLLRRASRKDHLAVEQALEEVNLLALANRQISQLSGGQQQRMFIARALAQEAEMMLMDEPLTGLDTGSQEDIFNILDRLREKRVTVLVALHDLKLAAERFEAVMLLNRRLVGFGAPDQVFQTEKLAQAYGAERVTVAAGAPAAGWLALDDTCCEGEHAHD